MIFEAKKKLAEALATEVQADANEVLNLIEIPKLYEHGHLALPVFTLAKKLKKNPMQWAQELSEVFSKKSLDFVEHVKPAGGFLNFTLKKSYLSDLLFGSLTKEDFYKGHLGQNKTFLIDFSSPNIAKPMHIGHLRATIIGQVIYNLAQSQGFKTIGVNHIGDWGTQFGKLSWAYIHWGKEYDLKNNPMDALLKMYVRFHDEAEKNPTLEDEGAKTFKRLEDGDPEIIKIWKEIIQISLADFDRLYKVMKIKHDAVLGESFYIDKVDDVVKRLQDKNLLQESEGAQVVFFDEKDNMPPCLIRKTDGTSIYATRDLAAAIYRHEVQKADIIAVVTDVAQALHFKQVIGVLKKLGYEWAKDFHHITFGRYRFKDGKMSTRSGKVIFAEDVLNEAHEIVSKMMAEKNPDLANKDAIAWKVATGAVFFNDLVNDKAKDVEFDWARVTSTEGDSGPYVQYTAVRCKSILRKYGKPVPVKPVINLDVEEEQKLIFSLLRFSEVLEASFKQFKPNILAQYLLELCSHFSHFYHKCRILGEESAVENSRICLIGATEKVLVHGLRILNIESPEAM
jgi:arginyl-tRNA synthetase